MVPPLSALLRPAMDSTFTGPPNPWLSWTWVHNHAADLWTALEQHVTITLLALVMALLASFPLALLARRVRPAQAPILAATGRGRSG